VALSTVEAEFIALSKATTQALWLAKFFEKIGLPIAKSTIINANNNGTISISTNDKNHWYTKYIDVQYHFTKEQTKVGHFNTPPPVKTLPIYLPNYCHETQSEN